LDNLQQSGSGSSPLQPSAKLNKPLSPGKLKTSPFEQDTSNEDKQLKRFVLDNERATKLGQSIADLKLDSPSPLKRSTQPLAKLSEAPPPQWTLSNRSSQKGYEYLCRIGEAKEWIEKIIGEEIPSSSELATDALRDGVILAKLTRHFQPNLVRRIISPGKLQFKHTENINAFFQFLDIVRMPDLFRFELTDLYDKKNIPRVIFCLHALSFMMSQETNTPTMEKLSGKLEFSQEDIKKSETSLAGVSLPNFDSMNKQFGRELPKNSSQAFREIPGLKEEIRKVPSASPLRRSELQSPFLDNEDRASPHPSLSSNMSPYRRSKESRQEPNVAEASLGDNLIAGYNASPRKQKKLSDSNYLNNIIKFQSIARGSIFRYNMFINRIMLKSMAENVSLLQSLVRRSLALRKFKGSITCISDVAPSVIEFQARVRGKILRSRISSFNVLQPSDKTTELQSVARGRLLRIKVCRIDTQLSYNEPKILKLQSLIRRSNEFTRVQKVMKSQKAITKFQAEARRHLLHKRLNRSVREAHTSEEAMKIIQSVFRGYQTRQEMQDLEESLTLESINIIELQSIARGGLARTKLNQVLDTLDSQDGALSELCAIIKGSELRSRVQRLKEDLRLALSSVLITQSQVRGVLSRYGLELLLDELDFNAADIVELQALLRRHLYHKSKKEVMRYYEQHLLEIIKIQSYIRGKYLGNAYKSLISMENPPLSVIKKFAYLLNDNDVDFEEEVRLTRLKESINEKTSSNELLEKHISQLDLKIALLQKNKITVDELLVQKNKNIADHPNVSTIDITSLNRRAKTRMEHYEKLFYLLQTQPSYLTRFIHSDYRGVDVALKIFSNLQSKDLPTREEYLFIRMIDSVLRDDISKSQFIHDIQKHTTTGWQRLLCSFNETQQTKLRSLFGSMIEEILGDVELDLQSDPLLIYQKVHNTPKNIPVDKAIEDNETKIAFINNLQQIREYGSEVYRVLSDNVDKLPIHIRLLAKSAYVSSMKKFPHQLEQEHLANAGFVFINGYINLIFESPDSFGICPLNKAVNSDKNLNEISKLLTQMFIMKPFGAEEIYLQPLNKFITSSVNSIRSLIKDVIDTGEIDTSYNMTVYDDITAHNRPKLTLRVSDMLAIDKLIQNSIDVVAPLSDDTLREVLVEIKSNNATDISRLNGYYTLSLNPSSYKSSLEDTRNKSLSMQTKRCVLYLVQVQDEYDDLFNLLKSRIDPIHEIKFKQIISAERRDIKLNRVNEYVNDGQGFLGDLTKISYHKLKQIALERILELEAMGYVTRRDSFQVLLNEMAHDIKTKHDQRLSRKRQLSIAENALIRLGEKHRFLQDQLDAYNVHIDKSMEELQSKPSKQKRILPFTKQFFYERELKKSGKLPKFGAYKYSCKRLYEKGVLVELRGLDQNLGSSGSSFFGGISFPKIDFMFNCDRAGEFTISCKSGTAAMNGVLETLTIDQFLEYQFENKPHISLFDGMVKFDTNCLIDFIFKKFYHYNED
jgi:Ras GTPase-activating-like protein IQGAP2/3